MKHSLAKQVAFIRNTPVSLLLVKVANANVKDIYECLYTNQPVDGVYDRQQMYTVYTLLLDSPMHTISSTKRGGVWYHSQTFPYTTYLI